MRCTNIHVVSLNPNRETPAPSSGQLLVSAQFNPIGLFQRDAAGTAAFKCYTNSKMQERKGVVF